MNPLAHLPRFVATPAEARRIIGEITVKQLGDLRIAGRNRDWPSLIDHLEQIGVVGTIPAFKELH